MKKQFEQPTIEVFAFESEDVLTVSGLKITDGTGTTEYTKSFSEVSSIFDGVL